MTKQRFKVSSIIASILVLIAAVLILSNSTSIVSIKITTNDGVQEKVDRKIPFLKSKSHLPDYRMLYKVNGSWKDAGTIKNSSAKDGLTFKIPKQATFELLEKIKIVDADIGPDQILEEVVVDNTKLTGSLFRYELASSFSLGAGGEWYFSTVIGKAILLGITIAVALLILFFLG